jgi:ribosome-associated translation inhibitor RaiA
MVERITYRDVKSTKAVERELLDARSEIEDRFNAVVSITWTLEMDADEAVAKCQVHSRSGYYRAHARSRKMATSIADAVERLVVQRRRKKAIRRKVIRRTA